MNRTVLANATLILGLCYFNEAIEAALNVSAFVLIGAVALQMALVICCGPLLSAVREGGARYENRLMRRPQH